MVHPSLTTQSEFGRWTQRVSVGEILSVNARNGESMVYANNVVRALLPVGGQVTRAPVVAGQALVSRYSSAFENRQ